jgi:hypothetical protein
VGDVEEAGDPAGGRRVEHHRVVHPAAVGATPDGLGGLAGDQHVTQTGGDRGGEVDHAHPGQHLAHPPQPVEHLQVFEHGLLGVHGQRVDVAAARGDRDPPFPVRQRRHVEHLRYPLAPLDLDQQHLPALRGEGERQ